MRQCGTKIQEAAAAVSSGFEAIRGHYEQMTQELVKVKQENAKVKQENATLRAQVVRCSWGSGISEPGRARLEEELHNMINRLS